MHNLITNCLKCNLHCYVTMTCFKSNQNFLSLLKDIPKSAHSTIPRAILQTVTELDVRKNVSCGWARRQQFINIFIANFLSFKIPFAFISHPASKTDDFLSATSTSSPHHKKLWAKKLSLVWVILIHQYYCAVSWDSWLSPPYQLFTTLTNINYFWRYLTWTHSSNCDAACCDEKKFFV